MRVEGSQRSAGILQLQCKPMLAPNLATVRALIFDLDGTLIDSKEDLVLSVNAMLAEMGRPQLPGNAISSYIGQGAPTLVRRALEAEPSHAGNASRGKAETHAESSSRKRGPGDPRRQAADDQEVQRGLEFFLHYYEEHRMQHTRAYPGVREALGDLNGYPMAVLTNKPERISMRILADLGLACFFQAVYGGNSFSSKKPDPLGVHTILKQFAVSARDALLVGDSDIDVQTARNAGAWAASVTYGFGLRDPEMFPADVTLERLTDLPPLLGNHGGSTA